MLIIGVPVRNDLESLEDMFLSLTLSTAAADKIVFVLGANITDGADIYCDKLAVLYSNVQVIHADTKTPLEAYNILFNLAKEEKADLFLTQTDVVFPKLYHRDWLRQMANLAKQSNIGAITCINGGGVSGKDYLEGFNWIGGWCSYYPLRTLEIVGGFDTDFPNGFGVDIDHSYQITLAGLQIVRVNYWVDHHMQNERSHDTSPEAESMKQASAKYFRKKYKLGEFA